MGTIKDGKYMDPREVEDINKRMQEDTEELYNKNFNDSDNHNAVITHLEPDVLEWEVKWTLESITMNKASGGDGIPAELFHILQVDGVKVLHSMPGGGHRTVKCLFSFQYQRKVMPKNVQTTVQLCSFHVLAKECLIFPNLGFSSM